MSIYARQDRKINAVVFNGTPYGSVIVDNRVILAPLFNFGISADGESCTVSPGRDHYEGELEIPATYAGLPVRLLSGFEGQNLEKVTALSGTAFTSDYCFSECTDLQEIYGITGAGRYAFQNCYNLYKIGATMYHLSEGSFYGCMALSEITLGNGIGAIPFNCFYGCDNLTTVYFLGTEYEWNGIVIQEGNEALTNAEIIFHTHTYSDWEITKNPGCGTEGEEERTCSGCGAKEIHTIAASDHAWGEWNITLEATCTANGEEKRYCPQCKTYDTRYTSALDHDLGEPYTNIEPTCTSNGEECQVCQREGCDYYVTRPIDKKSHTWGEWEITLESSCTSKGERKRSCFCGETEIEDTDALGHDLGDWEIVAEVTDMENGQKRRRCQREGCDYYEDADIVAPANLFIFTDLGDHTCSVKAKGNLIGHIKIPGIFNNLTVVKIEKNAFKDNTVTSVVIPDSVTTIEESAFEGCSSLTHIVIGESVTSIGDYAFYGCSSLYVVKNNSGLSVNANSSSYGWIGKYAYIIFNKNGSYYGGNVKITDDGFFYKKQDNKYTLMAYVGEEETVTLPLDIEGNPYIVNQMRGVTDVIIPKGFTYIDSGAFSNCKSIITIAIPNSITSIGDYAFYNCKNLIRLDLPNSIKSIGNGSFEGCENLTDIYIRDMVAWFNIDFTGAYAHPNNNDNSTLHILDENDRDITEIIIPSSISAIPDYAFKNALNVTSVTIHDGLTNIGDSAFENCTSLDINTLPDTVTRIGAKAFNGTPYFENYQNWNNYVLYLGKHLISTRLLISGNYTVKNGTITIASDAFADRDDITSVTIPNSVKTIGHRAFLNCKSITNLTIPDSVEYIGHETLRGCSGIVSLILPYIGNFDWKTEGEFYEYPLGYHFGTEEYEGGVATVQEYYSFWEKDNPGTMTETKTFYIPEGLRTVEVHRGNILHGAFQNCTGITKITLPTEIDKIGKNSFLNCENLEELIIPVTLQEIDYSAFEGCSKVIIQYYGDDKKYRIENNCLVEVEGESNEIIFGNQNSEIPSTASSIGSGAFYGNTYFEPIKIPLSVTKIGSLAFGGKPVTVYVEAPKKPTGWADDWCDPSVTVVWGYVIGLEKLQFTAINSTEYAVSAADENISGDIVLPSEFNGKRVTKVNMSGFADCKNITSVVIREGIYIIEEDAFRGCDNLKKVITPDSMRSIHAYAFAYCSSLECFVLSKDIELIGAYALPNDLGRDYIYYKGSNDDFAKVVIGEGNGVRVTTIYYYSDFYPTGKLKYWRYVDGEIVVWDVIEDDGSCSHTYGGWTITVTPTCTRLGRMERRCSACGYVDIEMIPVLKHIYEEAIIEPTCTARGYATYTCSRCKHSYTETIPALDHDWDKGFVRIEPTCTSNGVRRHTCTRCGVTIDTGISALRHDWGEWIDVHPAECEIEGTRESTCTRCGETETRVIPATGHDWDTEVEIVEPTCTKGGYTIHTCNACGATRKDNFTGALGHNYVDGICTRCNNDKRGVVYYGVSAIPERYNSSFILGLDHKAAFDSHLESISVTPLADEYIYYCSPTAFGDCAFSYNNFVGGFTLIVEGLALTNAGGKTEAYNIYKSNQANLGAYGAITITITEKGR